MIGRKRKDPADVCLVLEGTYPYVSGGVSTWVHQIVTAMPELRFSVLFIGAEKADDAEYAYTLPENIEVVEEAYLFHKNRKWLTTPVTAAEITDLVQKCRIALNAEGASTENDAFTDFFATAAGLARRTSLEAVWKDGAVWELISELYEQHAAAAPFLDFFWACRFLTEPVWNLLGILHKVPDAKLYHSPSTGYAGLVAAVIARKKGVPFLLSEHGIYVRERIAEIHKASWLQDHETLRPELLPDDSVLRSMWIHFFELLARYSYDNAGHITALFSANARHQVSFGASAGKIEVIPNGIDRADFSAIVEERGVWLAERKSPVIGFLGRIVAIKDVKTLLHAAALVHRDFPQATFLIAGPTSEEPEYFKECEHLTRRLGLENVVSFPGAMERGQVLSRIDVMLLSSVSEGLPFVVLEAFGAGIPVVSTDVGACAELIHGQSGDAPVRGDAGIVVRVGDPQALAQALLTLLQDPQKAQAMGNVGRARVEASYSQEAVVNRFRALYTEPVNSNLQPDLAQTSAPG